MGIYLGGRGLAFLVAVISFFLSVYVSDYSKELELFFEAICVLIVSVLVFLVMFEDEISPENKATGEDNSSQSFNNATCSLCGGEFRVSSEIGHHLKTASFVTIRTTLLTAFAGPIGFFAGIFGGSDPPYRPICENCCGNCGKRKSVCICDDTYKHCSVCHRLVAYGEWITNSGECSGCHTYTHTDGH